MVNEKMVNEKNAECTECGAHDGDPCNELETGHHPFCSVPLASIESKLEKLGEMPGTNIDLKDAMHDKLTRQQRRAHERLSAKGEAALAKMNANVERAVFGEEQAAKFQRMRTMLFALVKREGRVRFTQQELNAIEPRAGLDVKVGDNGDLTVTYLRGRDR